MSVAACIRAASVWALLFAVAVAVSAGPAPDAAALFDATLTDLEGRPVALAKLRGVPLIVNFWARWCAPCRAEFPEFVRVTQRQTEVRVIGIGLEDNADAVREFVKAYDINYRILLAKEQGISLLRAVGDVQAGLPFTLVIDHRGRVLRRKLGIMTRGDIESAVHQLRQRNREGQQRRWVP
jgi:thiol-disulfide isomerase/thioredoxin